MSENDVNSNDGYSGDGERGLRVPVDALSKEALDGLVEEYVTRDGTDYGLHESSLRDKKDAVLAQLHTGEAVIVYDVATETTNIVNRETYRRGER